MTEQPKAAATRIYVVAEPEQGKVDRVRLVRASTPAQALRHVTRNRFSVDVASQDELVALVASAVKVEDATSSDGA